MRSSHALHLLKYDAQSCLPSKPAAVARGAMKRTRWRVGLVLTVPCRGAVIAVLCFEHVENGGFKIVFVVNPATTGSLRPEVLTPFVIHFQMSRTSGFKLFVNRFWFVAGCSDHNVHMV